MTTVPPKRELERRLSAVEGFDDPVAEREQYRTPSPIAAHVVHLAALHGDLDRPVLDLGAGTGMLAIGAALAGARRVVGLDLDASAIAGARENAASVAPDAGIDWVLGDATRAPVCAEDATVLMNPPFGAQQGARHADRAFLETAADLAAVSYSIHNRGSEAFVESFADDHGAEVTHAYAAAFEIPHQFEFHEEDSRTISTEVFRIEWRT